LLPVLDAAMNTAFLAAWLQQNLPPPGRVAAVDGLAARLRADARSAGIELEAVDAAVPSALEDIIHSAISARLEVAWGSPVFSPRMARAA
jgi:hypothetical protein